MKIINEKGKLLDGASFTLYSDSNCTKEIKTLKTESGYLMFNNLKDRTTYYLKETDAPDGYRIPLDENGNVHVFKIYVEATPVKGVFDFYIDDVKYTSNQSNDSIYLEGDITNRIIVLTIINQTGKVLPETGSFLMFPLMIMGCGLMIFAYKKLKENK